MAPRNRKIHSSRDLDSSEPDQTIKPPPRTCPVTGKRVYPNEPEAIATAKHRMSDSQSAAPNLRTYKCLYCSGYHLTSKKS
jgi:hypothetical protein